MERYMGCLSRHSPFCADLPDGNVRISNRVLRGDSFSRSVAITGVLLFCSSANVGAVGQIEKEYKATGGCKFVQYSDSENPPKRNISRIDWSGKCKAGYLDGKGVATVYYDDGMKATHSARFERGAMEGEGTSVGVLVQKMEVQYKGELSKGKPNGRGVMAVKNFESADKSFEYDGNFSDGKFSGNGILRYPKVKIEGEFRNNKPHGNGKMTYNNGQAITGFFSDGQPPSSGRIDYPNGETYVGQLVKNQPEGKGQSTAADGTVYSGEFRAGKPEGEGVIQRTDGSRTPVTISDGKISRRQSEQEIAAARASEERRQAQARAYEAAVDACRARMANSVAPTNGNIGAMLAAAAQCNENPGVQPPPPPAVVVVPSSAGPSAPQQPSNKGRPPGSAGEAVKV